MAHVIYKETQVVAASANELIAVSNGDQCTKHQVLFTGTGTATIAIDTGDGVFHDLASGKTASDVDIYEALGVANWKITETGGANSITARIIGVTE